MSKVYNYENQLILRVPLEIAKKLNEEFAKEKPNAQIEIQPFIETQQLNNVKAQTLKFKMKYNSFQGVGTLVELPCITESYKSKDNINFYKSNDISQMILIENMNKVSPKESNQNGIRKVFEKRIESDSYLTQMNFSDSGLTPPTQEIRKNMFRKPALIPNEELKRVEQQLVEIQRQFVGGDDEDQSELSSVIGSEMQKKRKLK